MTIEERNLISQQQGNTIDAGESNPLPMRIIKLESWEESIGPTILWIETHWTTELIVLCIVFASSDLKHNRALLWMLATIKTSFHSYHF
jgi:hypothetical protein